MTQTTQPSTHSSSPLPDVFSQALTTLFANVQPGIVQVRTGGRGGGTGVIWDEQGHIITNNHVVGRSASRVEIHLLDGRTLPADVLQRNPRFDLALLKVKADNLKALAIGDSTRLRIGEYVFAIGHPWGQRWSITAGIVSGTSTVKLEDGLTMRYLKSDVLLAPGNSGGSLLNADGEVVGINAMISGGDLSISIPGQIVSEWLSTLPTNRAALGIAIQAVDLEAPLRQKLQPTRASALLIVGLLSERQGRYTDLLVGDILLDVDGQPVNNGAELRSQLSQHTAGEQVPIKLARGGEIITLNVNTLKAE